MSIYTKRGDKGITDMARTRNISKSDDRIQLGGAVDELSSHIGLMLYISIQRKQLKDRIKDLRYAMPVTADGDGILSHGFNREVAICDHKTVTVSHLT